MNMVTLFESKNFLGEQEKKCFSQIDDAVAFVNGEISKAMNELSGMGYERFKIVRKDGYFEISTSHGSYKHRYYLTNMPVIV